MPAKKPAHAALAALLVPGTHPAGWWQMKTYVGMGPFPLVSAVSAGPVPASSIQIPARWRTGRRPSAQFLAAAVSILVDRTGRSRSRGDGGVPR
jgi:hypothetical protein